MLRALKKKEMRRVIICGPPHSGKSVFISKVKTELRRRGFWLYVFRACPDGEGDWFHETLSVNAGRAMELRARVKGQFSPELVEYYASSVAKLSLPLAFVDVGGRMSRENSRIMENATDYIIVSSDEGMIREWSKFCRGLGLAPVAELYSDLHGEDVPGKVVSRLDRGDDSITPCISWVADRLMEMVG